MRAFVWVRHFVKDKTNMADSTWKDDDKLKEAITKHVQQGLQRIEMLDFLKRDFPEYPWSMRTLDRRLRHFDIFYNDQNVEVEGVKAAVENELKGPGKLLGYRAMHRKIRQEYGINATRDQVYNVMTDLDPEGLEARGGIGAKKKRKKGNFTTRGSNWVHSLDGHDKLMGYQNSTFPLAIYGCLDTASRKLLWLRVWTSNSDPKVVGRWYLEYLYETRVIPAMLRVDKGTETGVMATMHAFLRRHHGDMDPNDTVIYGPSTANQIERWWKELHDRMEKYYKDHLRWLKDQGHYDPHNDKDRMLLAFIMIPLIQKDLDVFRESVWNTHRIRAQKHTILPDGIPNHMYSFPEQYGLEECGLPVTEKQLEEAATQSGILTLPDDFIEPEFRSECERVLPDRETIKPHECRDAYMYLKSNFQLSAGTSST